MNQAAISVMEEFRDIIMSYGQSDEYSFVFKKDANIYNRRSAKILSYVTSVFTSSYVHHWPMFKDQRLEALPSFDGRIVVYPSDQNLKDYMSWRQADVHVNNLYNTAFWNLVLKSGLTNQEAEARLRGTFSADKNELLFSEFGINYNSLPAMFRKGTILLRKRVRLPGSDSRRQMIFPIHDDMIKEKFWKVHEELLGKYHSPEVDVKCEENELLMKQIEKLNFS